jgi:hypothetical protein
LQLLMIVTAANPRVLAREARMAGFDLLLANLTSPIVLAFVLGAIAGFIRSDLELPEQVVKLLSIYLLFSIGLTGGRELAQVRFGEVAALLALTVALTLAIPVTTYVVLRRAGGFDIPNAAAVAAHYGSVSSATFFASVAFARAMNTPSEGYMTAVVAIMEFAVILSLVIARWGMSKEKGQVDARELFLSSMRGRGIILLVGGMIIGASANDSQWGQISPFYEQLFRGFLMLFLLEMGMTAARKIGGFAEVGRFMTAFAVLAPISFGLVGVWCGWMIGLGLGGAFVLGAVCASASFIDAPAACRAALPEANPGIYLTASLGVTLPFNLLLGIPLYYQFARLLYGG